MMTSEDYRKTKAYRNAIKFLNEPVIPGVLLDAALEREVTFTYHKMVLDRYLSILEWEFKNVTSS